MPTGWTIKDNTFPYVQYSQIQVLKHSHHKYLALCVLASFLSHHFQVVMRWPPTPPGLYPTNVEFPFLWEEYIFQHHYFKNARIWAHITIINWIKQARGWTNISQGLACSLSLAKLGSYSQPWNCKEEGVKGGICQSWTNELRVREAGSQRKVGSKLQVRGMNVGQVNQWLSSRMNSSFIVCLFFS